MAHVWSGWPGAYCTRCGAEQVLEIALADGWTWFEGDMDSPDRGWKSPDHVELVRLCDGFCYADMTPEEQEAHKAKVKALQDKLGV